MGTVNDHKSLELHPLNLQQAPELEATGPHPHMDQQPRNLYSQVLTSVSA